MASKEETYACLDKFRNGECKPSELGNAIESLRCLSPVQYDTIVRALADARQRLADDILHAKIMSEDADNRQVKMEFEDD